MGMMTLSRGCLALVSVLLLSACSDGDSVIGEPVVGNDEDSVSSNVAPVITSAPLTTATEDVPYEYQLAARDPDDPNNGSALIWRLLTAPSGMRSEEHTSELQSREKLVCRLLLEKKNTASTYI